MGWIGALAVLIAVTVICLVSFYPGTIYYDASQSIAQARSGEITDWWTPMGSLLLRGWLQIGLGLGLVFVVQTVLFIGGAFALAKHALSPGWAAVATAAIVFWPPTFPVLSTLSRDTFFIAFILLTLAALASAYRADELKARRGWLAGALALALACLLIRQNGLLIVLVVAAAGFVLLRGPESRVWSGRLPTREGLTAVGVALAVGLGCLALTSIANRVAGVDKAHPESMLYTYDLATISTDTGKNQFTEEWRKRRYGELVYSLPSMYERFSWKNAASIYPPLVIRPESAEKRERSAEADAKHLRRMWFDAVTSNPLAYARERLRVNASGLGLYERATDAAVVSEEPTGLKGYGPPPKYKARNKDARSYITTFAGGGSTIPLDIPLLYLVLGLVAAAHLWRRWTRDRGLIVAIGACGLLNILLLSVATMTNSYRFYALLAPLSMVLAAWALAQLLADRRTGSAQ
jgi:hypothetical protein